jgi:hypothetical protein
MRVFLPPSRQSIYVTCTLPLLSAVFSREISFDRSRPLSSSLFISSSLSSPLSSSLQSLSPHLLCPSLSCALSLRPTLSLAFSLSLARSLLHSSMSSLSPLSTYLLPLPTACTPTEIFALPWPLEFHCTRIIHVSIAHDLLQIFIFSDENLKYFCMPEKVLFSGLDCPFFSICIYIYYIYRVRVRV